MSNVLYNFNPGRKSWKIYANEITSISGDDLIIIPDENKDIILEVSENNNIIFKKGNDSYNLQNLSNNSNSSGHFILSYFSGYLNTNITSEPSRKIPNQNLGAFGSSVDTYHYYLPSKLNGSYVFTSTNSGTSSGAQANFFDVTDPNAILRFPDIGVYKIHIQLWSDGGANKLFCSFVEMNINKQITDILYSSKKQPHGYNSTFNDLDMEIIYETTTSDQEIYLVFRIDGGGSTLYGVTSGLENDPRNTSRSRINIYRMK